MCAENHSSLVFGVYLRFLAHEAKLELCKLILKFILNCGQDLLSILCVLRQSLLQFEAI